MGQQLLSSVSISPYTIDKLILSHSSRSSMQGCERRGIEFRQMFGRPSFEYDDQFAAECGKALHAGFETWMMTHDENRAALAFGVAYPHELEYLKPKNAERSLEACFTTLQALMKSELLAEYDIAKIKLPSGEIKHAIEVPFAIQITGSPFPLPVWYVGLIDAILRHRVRGDFVASDLKSTRLWVDDLSLKYEFDEQTVPYAIVLAHILGQEIVELDVKYISARIDLIEPKIKMYPIKKTLAYLQDWHIGLCDDIAMIARSYKRQWFKRATSGDVCMAYNKRCDFADICAYRDPHVLARMIAGEPRVGLFSDPTIQPWITAELPYVTAV